MCDKVRELVCDEVRDEVRDKVCDEVRGEVRDKVHERMSMGSSLSFRLALTPAPSLLVQATY